jgi:lysophospholipase L1-like esterase
MKKIYIAGLIVLSFTACKPNLDPSSPSAGNADFSTYLAVGNSLTAGYADGTLYRSGQENSYPSMLAEQFKLVGGGPFKQPLLNGNAGYPSPKRVLGLATDCKGTTSLSPVFYSGPMDTAGDANNIASQGPFNNVGVPGIRCIDYGFTGYGFLNPYAKRFYSSPLTEKPLDEALKINATFFSCWLGSNDVLGYATSGGAGSVGGIGTSDISPTSTFTATYNAVINALTANGAKGVLINIPDVTAIPFFTTVPPNGLVLDQTQAAQLSAAYQALGISFTAGQNYFIIQDASAPGGLRKAKAGELILLTVPQDSLKCAGWGSIKPIPKQYVLDATEVANVQSATATFNAVIKQAAADHNLAYVDINSYLHTVAAGIVFNGVNFNTTFVQGGAFSLDGVHLTPRGYAIVANEMIRTINAYYKSSIPTVDVNKYSGLKFP